MKAFAIAFAYLDGVFAQRREPGLWRLALPLVLADTRAETAGTRTTPDKLLAALESLDG